MEWADARIWRVVPVSGAPDPRLRELLAHVHMVQRAFLTAWRGENLSPVLRRADDFATLDELRAWARHWYGEARAFLAGLSDEQLAQPMEMPWTAQVAEHLGRTPGPTTFGETCLQVANHSTHHRGQVNVRLRAMGLEPPLVDYIAWLWFDRPDPEWS